MNCSLCWEGKLAQPPCWFSLPLGVASARGRSQPRGEWWGGQRPGVQPVPCVCRRLLWALPSPVSYMASLHLLPFLGFASFRTSHRVLLWRLNPGFTSPAVPQPLPCSPLLCLWEGGSPGPQAGVVLGKELLGLALPPPSLHTCLRPSPLPRAHIWPKCSAFLAVNCLPLPLGIFSGFGFMSLFLLGSSGQAGVSAPFVCRTVQRETLGNVVILPFESWVRWGC